MALYTPVPKTKFPEGTIVRLKSGGPPMTAERTHFYTVQGVMVDVVWFDGATLSRDHLAEDALLAAEAEAP